VIAKQREIQNPVTVTGKYILPVIAALRDMMSTVGQNTRAFRPMKQKSMGTKRLSIGIPLYVAWPRLANIMFN